MSPKITLHELTGSPNNVKVRIALGYKGLEYERKEFALDSYPGDRSPIARLSRQPRLPVIQDGEIVLFDSGAIMRYLEANYPDTPSLVVDDYAAFGEMEKWELFAKTQIGEPVGMIFGEAFKPEADKTVVAKANTMLGERTGALEDKLSTGEFLVGDHLTIADITCAAPLYLADLTEANAKEHPISGFFHASLKLGEDRPKTRAWVRKVMAYDPIKGKR